MALKVTILDFINRWFTGNKIQPLALIVNVKTCRFHLRVFTYGAY